MRRLDRDGRRQVAVRLGAVALIALFAVQLGRESTSEWWNDQAQPLIDLGWVLLLTLPLVVPASAVAGWFRRRRVSVAGAISLVLVVVQATWVGWMVWFAAEGYAFRDVQAAPFGIWLLCALWAGVALAVGAVVEELVAGGPPQSG